MLRPLGCKTFGDYNKKIVQSYNETQLQTVNRIYVILDRYLPKSLKQSTREKRVQSTLWLLKRMQASMQMSGIKL